MIESGTLPATEFADAKSPRLGGLIWTVLVLDSVGCLYVLFVCLSEGLYGLVARHIDLVFVIVFFAPIALPSVPALIGNTLILLRRRQGSLFAFTAILLVPACSAYVLWELRSRFFTSPLEILWFPLLRVCWLILYGIVVRMAGKKLSLSQGGCPCNK
jgi:hypothetical protein